MVCRQPPQILMLFLNACAYLWALIHNYSRYPRPAIIRTAMGAIVGSLLPFFTILEKQKNKIESTCKHSAWGKEKRRSKAQSPPPPPHPKRPLLPPLPPPPLERGLRPSDQPSYSEEGQNRFRCPFVIQVQGNDTCPLIECVGQAECRETQQVLAGIFIEFSTVSSLAFPSYRSFRLG